MRRAVHKATVMAIAYREIGINVGTIKVYSDSQVAVDMISRGHLVSATKHLAMVFAEVKEAVDAGLVSFHHVPGVANTSDLLTKPLPRVTFTKHSDVMLGDIMSKDKAGPKGKETMGDADAVADDEPPPSPM